MTILEEIIGSIILTIVAVFIIIAVGYIIYGFIVTRRQNKGALKREFRNINLIQSIYDAQGGPEGIVLDESMIDKNWLGLHLITNDKELLILYELLGNQPVIRYNLDLIYDLKKNKYKIKPHVK